MTHRSLLGKTSLTLATGLIWMAGSAQADQQILDDLIVEGSICAGLDCSNGESFGFDTLRLKENNLRIKFQDTSATASFPSRDWQITANDSGNGGANKFSIDDIDGGRTPFTIEAGAPSHSLFVDDGGRIGFGTSTPVSDLHVVTGNTPTLRLEQDGTSGFGSQTWDLAGNEANFFIRDATNGSPLAFRIFPGSGTANALSIASDGDIGLGTTGPDGPLHVFAAGTDANTQHALVVTSTGNVGIGTGTAVGPLHVNADDAAAPNALVVEDTTGDVGIGTSAPANPLHILRATGAVTNMVWLENNDGVAVRLVDTGAGGENWAIQSNNGEFRIVNPTGAGQELRLTSAGNATITGALTENSDKNNKMAIVPLDTAEILEKVMKLPLSAWTYKHDAEDGTRHIGPMAQDFYALFGTGQDETGISTIDTAGVALAAIQALEAKNAEQAAVIAELLARVKLLETGAAE